MEKKMMKYNPAFLTDDELIAGFVIRTKELESILTIIRENISGPNQHILVEGPRGSGKTTLVRRVAAQVKKDDKLNRQWYPILFAEESYMVQTPGEFWLEAIFHLEHQTGEAKWGQIYKELKEERDEARLRDGCLAKLIDFADQQKKRLLLVVENMQMILGDQLSNDAAWVLRKTLQHEPKIMMLCTSLSGRAEDFNKESKAMYELFKRIDLKPLNDEESKALWESVAGKPIVDNRIRPINILTGGNPRLVSIISEFGANMSFKNLMDNLIQLVDDNTEYFKSHLDSIAPIERKIYLALAEIWKPATAKEVASVARLDVNKTSAVLGRLEQEGRVAFYEQKGRKKFYKVAERMYNIYYLMRRRSEPSSRIKALVQFIITYYESEKLINVFQAITSEAIRIKSELRLWHCVAFKELMQLIKDKKIKNDIMKTTPVVFFTLEETKKATYGIFYKHLKDLDKLSLDVLTFHDKLANLSKGNKNIQKLLQNDVQELIQDNLNIAKSLNQIGLNLIKIFPYEERAWVAISASNIVLEQYDNAKKNLIKIIEFNPSWSKAYGYLSLLELFKSNNDQAKKHLYSYLKNASQSDGDIEFTTYLLIKYASRSLVNTKEVLEMLSSSVLRDAVAPIETALRLFIGENVVVADEILEVAKDIVKKIEEQAKRVGNNAPDRPDN